MPTIRVKEWTKERINEIREEESHSSHDSVIKSLLKDRELATFADPASSSADRTEDLPSEPTDKAFDDLTVLAEMVSAENGVLFLWCPNCGNEIAHLGVENPVRLPVFEVECQRCLSRLDQYAIVGIEIGYPIEQRTVEGQLEDELRTCVIDYWDRTLRKLADGSLEPDVDTEYLVWQFNEYVREFQWDWPTDVPVVGVVEGQQYRDDATDDVIEILECVSENRNALNDFRIRRDAGSSTQTEVLDAATITNLLVERQLYPIGAASGIEPSDST